VEGTAAFSPAESWQQGLAFSWKIGLLILLILVGLMFLLKRRRAPVRPPLLQGPPSTELAISGIPENLLPGTAAPIALTAGQTQQPALPEQVDGKEKVGHLIASYPDRAVEVLRLWIHEKDGK
jgi:hypothetical protein